MTGPIILSVAATLAAMLQLASASSMPMLQIQSGETLEIMVEGSKLPIDASWVLTRNREFAGAQRGAIFQTRLVQSGEYVLDATIEQADPGQRVFRTMTIQVNEAPYTSPEKDSTSAPLQAKILAKVLWPESEEAFLKNGGLLLIDASLSRGPIISYGIDTDINVDSDGDGNPGNDYENRGTMSERSGNKIYVWVSSNSQRTIGLQVFDANGASSSATTIIGRVKNVTSSEERKKQRAEYLAGSSIRIERNDDGSIRFQLDHQVQDPRGAILRTWDFGDRKQSLLDEPIHTYKGEGRYVVSVTLTDITSGQTIGQATGEIQIDGTGEEVASDSGASSTSSSEDNRIPRAEEPAAGQSFFGGVMSRVKSIAAVGGIVLTLLSIAGALYALLQWLKNLTTGSLQKALEKAEEGIVKEKKVSAPPLDPTPMQLKVPQKAEVQTPEPRAPSMPETIREREMSQPEMKPSPNTSPLPSSNGPTPPWLMQKPPAPPSTPTPSRTSPPPPPTRPTAPAIATPSFIKPQTSDSASKVPVPAPPLEQKSIAPQTTASSSVSASGSVPAWLQSAPKTAPATTLQTTPVAATPVRTPEDSPPFKSNETSLTPPKDEKDAATSPKIPPEVTATTPIASFAEKKETETPTGEKSKNVEKKITTQTEQQTDAANTNKAPVPPVATPSVVEEKAQEKTQEKPLTTSGGAAREPDVQKSILTDTSAAQEGKRREEKVPTIHDDDDDEEVPIALVQADSLIGQQAYSGDKGASPTI